MPVLWDNAIRRHKKHIHNCHTKISQWSQVIAKTVSFTPFLKRRLNIPRKMILNWRNVSNMSSIPFNKWRLLNCSVKLAILWFCCLDHVLAGAENYMCSHIWPCLDCYTILNCNEFWSRHGQDMLFGNKESVDFHCLNNQCRLTHG